MLIGQSSIAFWLVEARYVILLTQYDSNADSGPVPYVRFSLSKGMEPGGRRKIPVGTIFKHMRTLTYHHEDIRQGNKEVSYSECPYACANKESDTTSTKGGQK